MSSYNKCILLCFDTELSAMPVGSPVLGAQHCPNLLDPDFTPPVFQVVVLHRIEGSLPASMCQESRKYCSV